MRTVDMLEETTLLYWELSRIWNGREEAIVSTGDAIEWCSNTSSALRPDFDLKRRTKSLLDEIVSGGSQETNDNPSNILPLAKPIKKVKRSQSK